MYILPLSLKNNRDTPMESGQKEYTFSSNQCHGTLK